MHAVSPSSTLASISPAFTPDQVLSSFRLLLDEYHSLNVVFDGIEAEECRWSEERKRAVIRLGNNWRIAEYEEGHRHWLEERVDPYAEGFVHLKEAVAASYASKVGPKE
jgi:hypothetical protein